ncbi:MAG: hypothetical protein C5B50_05135 [Verrucomicrobia bacterium]|nr:MAG: hypothetical protein C5B50_05135 [Verrucomicrobiota bacterium]
MAMTCSALAGEPSRGGTPITGTPWIGQPGIVQTMQQIKSRDHRVKAGVPHIKHALVPESVKHATEQLSRLSVKESKPQPGVLTPLKNAQTVSSVNFTAATTSDCSGFPPDTMGAVGPSQFIITLNGRIRSFKKSTGATDAVMNFSTDSFFAPVMTPPLNRNFSSDPRIRYDRLSDRWFIGMIDVPTGKPNRVMLAVSSSGTITNSSNWTLFQFEHDLVGPTNNVDTGAFADYPTLAVDANAVYVGVNIFSNSASGFLNTTLFVIQKSSLLTNGPIQVTAFRGLITNGTGIFTPHGADNYDPAATEGYVVGTDRSDHTVLHLLRIATPGAVPAISEYLSIPIAAYASPILVPHLGNSAGNNGQLDPVDQRLMAAHYRNGLLWTCHNVGVDNVGGTSVITRDGDQWFALTNIPTGSTPAVSQSGIVYQPTSSNVTTAHSYWMGTIMVSGQGHAAMGFTSAASGDFINAGTCGRLLTDPSNSMQAVTLYTHSVTTYNPTGDPGSSRGRRWGDYSMTTLDPSDDMTMWTIQEFCSGSGAYGVRAVKLLAPKPALPTNCAPASLAQGTTNVTVIISGASSTNGIGFFDPGPGFSNRLAMAFSGTGITVNSLTPNDPTTITAVITVAQNAQAGARTVTVTNPDGQQATSTNTLLTILPGSVNNPPALASIPDNTLTVGTTLAFTNTATDPESPPETLTFSLPVTDPANATVDPVSGAFSWTPDNTQVGTNILSVIVTDNGSPPLSATQFFTLYVVLTNHPPVPTPMPNQTIAVGNTLVVTNTATDPDSPPSTLTYSFGPGQPFNATLNSTNGVLTWTPVAIQEGTNTLNIVVSDNGLPPASSTSSFLVFVLPPNTPPTLAAIANRTNHLGSTLLITNTAADQEAPPETLTFSFATNPPAGATIDPVSGIFSWTPGPAFLNTTNQIGIEVTDNGQPPLSDTKFFTATIVADPVIQSVAVSNSVVLLSWSAIAGQSYRLQSKTNATDTTWNDLAPDVTASGPTASGTDGSGIDVQRFYRVRALP